MKTTPMDIREYKLRKKLFGYDPEEVELLREMASGALTEAISTISALQENRAALEKSLEDHVEKEELLQKTITTAHSLAEGLKGSAGKEADSIVASARLRGEEIIRQANNRVAEIQKEILDFKRQRVELETSLKSVLDYHAKVLDMGSEESRKADEELDKLKFLPGSK